MQESIKIFASNFVEMPKKPEGRLSIPSLGEWYYDLLKIDAWINDRTIASQATSLLCAKLYQREETIQARLEYLAQKRGIPKQELWFQILRNEADPVDSEDIPDIL